MLIIEDWLPHYHYHDYQSRICPYSRDDIWAVIEQASLSEYTAMQLMLNWRVLMMVLSGDSVNFGVHHASYYGLIPLDSRIGEEQVFGAVGRFWLARDHDRPVLDVSRFLDFKDPYYCRLVWNVALHTHEDGTRLTTQTRIECLGERAHWHFCGYWSMMRPLIGFSRRHMLLSLSMPREEVVRAQSMEWSL